MRMTMRGKTPSLPISEWKCSKCSTWNNEYRSVCKQEGCNGKKGESREARRHYKSGATQIDK